MIEFLFLGYLINIILIEIIFLEIAYYKIWPSFKLVKIWIILFIIPFGLLFDNIKNILKDLK